MSKTQLTPSWILTTDHEASSYGQPVLVKRSTGEAFGRSDILEAYRSWGFLPAAKVVERMAKTRAMSEAERELVGRFCGLAVGA